MKRTIWFMISLLVLAALACGSSVVVDEPVDQGRDLPTPGGEMPVDPPNEEPAMTVDPNAVATITIVNRGETDICHVFIVPAGAADWGDDLLGAEETIPPDFEQDFTMSAGDYDLLLLNCDQEIIREELKVTVASDDIWEIR